MRYLPAMIGCAVMLACISCATDKPPATPPAAQTPAVTYFSAVQTGIGRTRSQMPGITDCANVAAQRIVAGGHLYATGSQPEFARELTERAGGLQAVHPLPADAKVDKNDVVLLAARSVLTQEDQLRVRALRQAGAYVIAFASAEQSASSLAKPDALIDSGPDRGVPLVANKICPTDTVINIMNAWAWTGEFIAACTRLGKMPVVYKSYHIDGGRERERAKYKDQTFHEDVTIDRIEPGVLGLAYLQQLARFLSSVRGESPPLLALCAIKLREATPPKSVLQVTGHMFPEHYQDPRTPQPFGTMSGLDPSVPPPAGLMTAVLAYQYPPQLAIAAAHVNRDMLLYSSVQRSDDDRAPNIVYIKPYWPLSDACVEIKGYDINALPASGVVQSAIYWALVAETYAQRAPAP